MEPLIFSFFNSLENELSGQLENLKLEETDFLQLAERSIKIIKPAIARLRDFVLENPFQKPEDEILFFKRVKPRIDSKFIYFVKIYRIESRRPVGSLDAVIEYLQIELEKINQSFINHQQFYYYYRSGSTFLDELYFIRGKQDAHFLMEMDWIYTDLQFSTGYDCLVSKMMAHEQLILYLHSCIETIKNNMHGSINGSSFDREKMPGERSFVQTPFRASEVYVFLKSMIDSQAIVNHTYKSFFEMLVPGISNMQKKSFTPSSLLKYSDKVDLETRENVKRLLQKMIRNVDNY